jgi:large subunit ribosomal protein L31e|mmetsp:Transcript_31539/g.41767  ORF Transcript_31539/g.41767 Transcript_31539/m.41767 type:complete len:121 (+) Transcript_31539:22-384(+)
MVKAGSERIRRQKSSDIVAREYTMHMAKYIQGATFKNRAPRAIREIKKFANKHMGTADVRIDASLNAFIWSTGIKSVPKRVRIQLSRRRNDDEDAKEKLYTLVTHVPGPVKGLETTVIEA